MRKSSQIKIAISTGLALFAMFFGAGNMIFPLQLGVLAGQHVVLAIFAFVITGVGFPFLGLFAVSLYEGDYWKFFKPLGPVFSFLIIAFLILIIGLMVGTPRTELITYHTVINDLPPFLQNQFLFNFIYFAIVYLLVFRQSHVVDIIGWFLSPIKIIIFTILILVSLHFALPYLPNVQSTPQVFKSGMVMGYGTMDLLAAIFFCTVAYRNIINKCSHYNVTTPRAITRITLYSCCLGAVLIAIIYAGLIAAAAAHAQALEGVATEALIGKIAFVVLGKYGSLFVDLCVTFACLATATALTEVTVNFLYQTIFRRKLHRQFCLLFALLVMYGFAILGFNKIMGIAVPILSVLYPALILFCVFTIARKAKQKKYGLHKLFSV